MKPYQKKYRPKAGKKNTVWTESDIDMLRTMYHAGFSKWDIAKELDRSSGAVQQRIYNMGLHKQPKLYETGESVSDALTNQDATMDAWDNTPTQEPTTWIGRIKRLLGIG
jgi:lysozyme family protein